MLIRRNRHRVPSLNTASTADISFMLLIFFLVTTSMDVDKGITRQLPPVEQTEDTTPTEIARDNIMEIAVAKDNKISVNGKPAAINGLRRRIETFVEKAGDKHLITIQTDADAAYNTYFELQNELVAAYASVRDKESMRRYGRHMAELTPSQRATVASTCRQHVAENYDNNTKGGDR